MFLRGQKRPQDLLLRLIGFPEKSINVKVKISLFVLINFIDIFLKTPLLVVN